MSKLLLCGDLHFRAVLPYAAAFEDGRQGEWEEVKKTLHTVASRCDTVVLMGDNLNLRNNLSSVLKEFVVFLKGFGDKPIHIIVGNHERGGATTALDFLDKVEHPNWHVYADITDVVVDGQKVTFLPYMTPGLLGVASVEEATPKIVERLSGGDVLLHHHVVAGTEWSGATSEHLNEAVLPRDVVESKYRWIAGGHVHEFQFLSEKTMVTGCTPTQEVGEHHKAAWILDTDKGFEEIPLPVRGIYAVTWKGDEFMAHIPNHSIVKCVVKDRGTDLDLVKKALSRFDAHIIVEQYPNERTKVGLDSTGALDLSVDNLLMVYSTARDVSYNDLQDAMKLLTQTT